MPDRPTTPATLALLINVEEVAGLLRISARSVWRLVASHDLPAPIALGRARRWPRAQIEAWVAAKANTNPKASKGGKRP